MTNEFYKTIVLFVAFMGIGVASMGVGYNLSSEEVQYWRGQTIERGFAEEIDGKVVWKDKHTIANEYLAATQAPPCCPGGVCPMPPLNIELEAPPLPVPPETGPE